MKYMNNLKIIKTPNFITFSRIVFAPLICFLLLHRFKYNFLFATILFLIAISTDYFDGKFARKQLIITDFGKFLDPIADKILFFSVFTCLLKLNLVEIWIIIILLIREFLVLFIRLLIMSKSKVVSSNLEGKLKTAVQSIVVSSKIFIISLKEDFNLSNLDFDFFLKISDFLLWISVFLALVSFFSHIHNNIDCIKG